MAGLRLAAQRKTAVASAVPPAAIALGIALATVPICVRAETKVRGTPQAILVEAQNASVEEVLVALTDTFKVRFRSAAKLDKRLTGTYQGTLPQAVSRILKGYNFAMKSGPAGLEVTLLGAGAPVDVVGARAATRPAEAPAAQQPPIAAVDSDDRPVPMAIQGLGGRTPVPVPTRAADAPSPVPQLGPGPVPSAMPAKPGDAPPLVPPGPTASSAAPPASPAPAPSPTRPMWVAQLIGENSETVALSRFRQLQGKLRSALGSYLPAILRTTLKDGTTWVRVRVEFDTRQGAEALCSKLEAAREHCLVQRN
jgi:SPOR domain